MSNVLYISGACFRSGLGIKPEEDSAHLIEIEERPRPKAGGHGAIFRVRSVDGKSVSGKLVKRLEGGFPPDLKDIVSALRVNVGSYAPDERVSLSALPLFLFESSLGGDPFHGYLMREVEGRTFQEILSEDVNEFINLPLETRLHLCLQFVEGMNVLYGSGIIHTDLNAQNLILDLKRRNLAIIDLDGGAVANTSSIPIALKFEPGWLAPEIDRHLVSDTRRASQVLDTRVDLWSIACGVHYLLFGLSAFFFAATQPDIEGYLKRYRWPSLRGLTGIELQNTDAFDYFERAYASVPDLHPLLQQSFQEGYSDPSLRINPYQWMRVIRRSLLQILTPESAMEARKQIRRYLTLALDDGILTDSEKEFILDQGSHLGITRAELEKIIDKEVRNWWGAVDQAVSREKGGLRAAQPDPVAPQARALALQYDTEEASRGRGAAFLGIMLVCLIAFMWLKSNHQAAVRFVSQHLPSRSTFDVAQYWPPWSTAQKAVPAGPPASHPVVQTARQPNLSHERLSSEVRRLLAEQGYSHVSARVRSSGKVYLYGGVNSAEEKQDVKWAVETIARVRKVVSHLRVIPQSREINAVTAGTTRQGPLGVETEDAPAGGALVVLVHQKSPADNAGIVPSDVITELDGERVAGHRSLRRLLRDKDAEGIVRLTISREGALKLVNVQLQSVSK